MSDKQISAAEAVASLESGMTIGFGGWGSRRKPMAFIREILRRDDLSDLTIVAYGGPDVGVLCRSGHASKAITGFVSLDTIALEPHYRAARQSGTIQAAEWDEGMLLLGLQASAWRVPFLPTRAGLGSDVLTLMPELKTIQSPYPSPSGGEGETMVAVPALNLDVAFVHAHRADIHGNAQLLGEDPFMDDLFVRAAERAYVSAERIIPTESFLDEGPVQTMMIHRLDVTGVVHAPGGAGFTECLPGYPRDESAQREYAATAKSPEAWDAWVANFVNSADATPTEV